ASPSASLSLLGNKELSPLPLIPAMWLTSRSCCVVACSASLISKALERMCAHTHPHTHTRTHTHSRTHTHTHTHARTYTHARLDYLQSITNPAVGLQITTQHDLK